MNKQIFQIREVKQGEKEKPEDFNQTWLNEWQHPEIIEKENNSE